ncbi:hypothetical protein IAQ61_010753 [Plenodomus lingam]|uniref:Predicted protein n=1 Tax=Leptosphaeria maculans (strain JN3 / isolate v23.1.3 / race Av1-4-5-6-7-8) TaxID=985895 RepID=E4ZJW3_LEPMJ|nr:predicted protein [Plenodomus lingam JN3]KAH9861017.1 hypothetical protein IAQ61_010753 [Plenodomus lingam]CBX91398.1 predicted protein [Plenodomus lingam JN3]
MKRLFTLFTITVLAFAGLTWGLTTPPTDALDFNELLDGSLGNMPALFLVSQGALLEVYAADPPQGVALGGDLATAATTSTATNSAAPSTQPADVPRTGKENGAVLGAFISTLLLPAVMNVVDGTAAGGICKSLVSGAGAMVGSVVGQEAGKNLYPNGTSLEEASEFEQGVIPGTFIGGIAGSSVGTALSKTLCAKLVPDLAKVFDGLNPDAVTKMSRVLNRGLTDVLTSHLKDLGVQPAKALNFAHQMGETLRLADTVGMPDAFDFLNRELVSNTADLAKAAAKGFKTTPALNSLVKLSTQTLSMGVPWEGSPLGPEEGPLSALDAFTGQYKQIMDFAKKVPGARKAAEGLSKATNRLHSATSNAAKLLRGGSLSNALSALDGAADETHSQSEVRNRAHEDRGRRVTTTSTLTLTITSVQTNDVTSMHTVKTTKSPSPSHSSCSFTAATTRHVTVTAKKTITETVTKVVPKLKVKKCRTKTVTKTVRAPEEDSDCGSFRSLFSLCD